MVETLYKMTIDLNVLNHLGINLYSNTPAVLAEVVANSWDADAEKVGIRIAADHNTITITDDGHGMSEEDINEKFLHIGYRRREMEEPFTPKHNRPVMGRKGIGKLSLFSIANTIEVQSARDGVASGFKMSLPEIEKAIEGKKGDYFPEPLPPKSIKVKKGTKIVLTNLRKRLTHTETALRTRLARRFSVIGPDSHFSIKINGIEIGITDRDYYHKIQYFWHYGPGGKECLKHCTNADKNEARNQKFLSGWIGTVKMSGQLTDELGESLNKIVVMVRGKLAQEDILESFGEGGIYTKYIIGEIHADYLDEDNKEDIATTSRQAIFEDDARYLSLKKAIGTELKHIQNQWTKFRNEEGAKEAMQDPSIKKWFRGLGQDDTRRARSIFGRINQVTVDDPEQRVALFKYGVLAFESLKARRNLDALEGVSADNIVQFGKVFGHIDDLEASLYHQIVSGRVEVVRALQEKVETNVLERVIQKHLFDHLWLLDPSWERATATEYMEKTVKKEFGKITTKLSPQEKKGRVDIKYRTTAGKHVIVELKRANVRTDTDTLNKQVGLYRTALEKILRDMGQPNEQIDVVCIVGKPLKDWDNPNGRQESEDILKVRGARVVLYQELINNAYKAYKDYLAKSEEAGRVFQLLGDIEKGLAG